MTLLAAMASLPKLPPSTPFHNQSIPKVTQLAANCSQNCAVVWQIVAKSYSIMELNGQPIPLKLNPSGLSRSLQMHVVIMPLPSLPSSPRDPCPKQPQRSLASAQPMPSGNGPGMASGLPPSSAASWEVLGCHLTKSPPPVYRW